MILKKNPLAVRIIAVIAMVVGVAMYVIAVYRHVDSILDFKTHAPSLPASAQPTDRP